jgi:hypothetical protein
MRKIPAKNLKLQREMVRHLSDRQLMAVVAGAADTDRIPTDVAGGCSPPTTK